jgi:cupin 2 domain-containing protein
VSRSGPRLRTGNLIEGVPASLPRELVDVLLETGSARLERIVSTGHATPPDEWYDQDADEWVLVVSGRAGLRVDGEDGVLTLAPGDWVLLPAHRRHRVEWTDASVPTIWLALHHQPAH